ncbi:MAG: tetratricopeptide repeat protein [Acidobacteriota bacterium]
MIWILIGLNFLLEIWMIVDCLRNRRYLWLIAMIVIPIGAAWVYFVLYKLPELNNRDMATAAAGAAGPSAPPNSVLRELEETANDVPSLANHLAFAEALDAAKRPADAAGAYERALAVDPDDKTALYGLGRARLEVDDAAGAVSPLERLVAIDPAYSDHEGWSHLALALRKGGDMDAAITKLEDLVERSPRLVHRLLLSRYLLDAGRPEEAVPQLEAALAEHAEAPVYLKRQDERRAKLAASMLAGAHRRMR